jgi:hypothetical protein
MRAIAVCQDIQLSGADNIALQISVGNRRYRKGIDMSLIIGSANTSCG